MTDEILAGMVLDEKQELSIEEMTSICSCQVEWIIDLVEEGVITPRGKSQTELVFSGTSVVRVRTATRLHRDLNVNLAGIALVLDLLDEIDVLHSRLGILE